MNFLEIDKFLTAKPQDLEGLPYYEIVSKLGLLSFNTQGNKPVDIIARLAGITSECAVLMAGCGSGGTAVHLAECTGATVYGIDISEESIKAARELAAKSHASDRLHFQIGDAHALPFAPDTFDVVITEYMAFFLRQEAFNGFHSVVKPGGHIALAEMMKDPEVNPDADAGILAAEKTYADLLGYGFHIPLSTEHVEHLTHAGFDNVRIMEKFSKPSFKDQLELVGGWKNLFKISRAVLKLMRTSTELKKKFLAAGTVKSVLIKKRSTARYIFQAIMMGEKKG